jgi:serine/threonine protein kinase
MKNLKHPNIVQFLGIHKDSAGNKYIVTEFISEGNLQSFMMKQKRFDLRDLISLSMNAAAGMNYLEKQGKVHRDLALRNLLITITNGDPKYLVKVGDFGLSRNTEKGVVKGDDKDVAIKWTAPEAIESRKYTFKSDVWSFGVVMWEIFSIGKLPYPHFDNRETLQKVKEGYRLPRPTAEDGGVDCPDTIYKLMLDCWSENPNQRPSFSDLLTSLENIWKQQKPVSSSSNQEHHVQQNTGSHYSVEGNNSDHYTTVEPPRSPYHTGGTTDKNSSQLYNNQNNKTTGGGGDFYNNGQTSTNRTSYYDTEDMKPKPKSSYYDVDDPQNNNNNQAPSDHYNIIQERNSSANATDHYAIMTRQQQPNQSYYDN